MDARRLAEQLYPAMNARRFVGGEQFHPAMDRRTQLEEFFPVDARRFGEQIPVANTLAANERRFDNSSGSVPDVRINSQGEGMPLSAERKLNDPSSVIGNRRSDNDPIVEEDQKSPVKEDDEKTSLKTGKNIFLFWCFLMNKSFFMLCKRSRIV